MRRIAILALLATCAVPALAASVEVSDGAIVFVADHGARRTLTTAPGNRAPVLSPDGTRVAYVHDPAPEHSAEDAPDQSELWLVDADGQSPRRLVENSPSDEPQANLTWFNSLAFAPDGRSLYFLTQAWTTSNALHRVDLETGQVAYITDANDVWVVTKGRHAGHLVVQKHKYYKGGGSYEHYWLVTPEGKEVRKVGATEKELERFLR